MKMTGENYRDTMANWTFKNQLLCQPHLSGNIFFPDRAVFFASAAKSASSDDGLDPRNAKNKKSGGLLDDLALTTSEIVDKAMSNTSTNELEDKLKKLRAESKISESVYDQARRLASGQRFLDQELVRKLIQGTVTPEQFKKYASFLHPDTGDAADRNSMQKLAELAIFGKIQPHVVDKVATCLESKSLEHKQAAEALIENPNTVKQFAEFILKNPLQKAATKDLAGATAFDLEQDILRKSLATFKNKELHEFMQSKGDNPESVESVRSMVKEFEQESKAHSEHWNELMKSFHTQVAKGDKEVMAAFEQVIGNIFPEPVRKDEKNITLADLEHALDEAKSKHGIDLAGMISPEMKRSIHQKVVYIQELSRKALVTKEKLEKEFQRRHEEVLRRQEVKRKAEEIQRKSGINLKPGTSISYRKITESPDGRFKKAEWAETEIKGTFIETSEEEQEVMIHVADVGRFAPTEFIKWVKDTEASQVIESRASLDAETEFDILGHPAKEGMVIAQPMMNPDGKRGMALRKIEKIDEKEGFIELDQPITLAHIGDTISGLPLETPYEKKRITFGEFAQWVRRTHAKPHVKRMQDVESAYNNWKKAKGNPKDVRFHKGSFLTYGPHEQKNLLYIKDVYTDETTGEQFVVINNSTYRASEVLDNAIAANWEEVDEAASAAEATKLISNPMQRIEVYNRTVQGIQHRKAKLLERVGDNSAASAMAASAAAASIIASSPGKEPHAGTVPALAETHSTAQAHTKPTESIKEGGGGGGHGGGGGKGGGGGDGHEDSHGHSEGVHDKHDAHGEHGGHGSHDAHHDPEVAPIPYLETTVAPPDPDKERQEEEETRAEREKVENNVYLPPVNELEKLWVETHLLSVQEMWQLAKHIWEYWERTWERKMKGRFSKFGANLPFINTEMLRIKEETEHHEVGTFKEAISAMGIVEIRGILNRSSNGDQIKACIEVLVDKGQMRWDDVRTWEAMNRIAHLPTDNRIPIPKDGNPYTPVSFDEKTGRKQMGMQYFGKAIDNLWGDGQYESWSNKNSGSYDSGMQGFSKQGDELESDPYDTGKIAGRLQQVLKAHMEGEWANPHEFEGLLRYMIDQGKSNAENKLFFIIAGCATRLMPIERLGAIANDLQNKLPFLAFLADQGAKKPGQNVAGPYTVKQLKALLVEFMEDPGITKPGQKYLAGPKVKDFLWKYALTNSETETRTIKAIRNGENIDHDDAQMVIPLLDEEWAQQVCNAGAGRKKYFTVSGYLNGYPGFSEWMRTLANSYDPSNPEEFKKANAAKLLMTVKAFVKYNGILTKRYRKDDDTYQRLDPEYFSKGSVVDANTPTGIHRGQLENVIRTIGEAYGISEVRHLFVDTPDDYKRNKDTEERQKDVESAHLNFGKALTRAIQEQGIEKMVAAIQHVGLRGFGYNVDLKAQEAAKKASANVSAKAEEASEKKVA